MLRILQLALAASGSQTGPTASSADGSPDCARIDPHCPSSDALVHEVENGVHYSVLPDVWRFVFRAARVHNVQVFATTHSWDWSSVPTSRRGGDGD